MKFYFTFDEHEATGKTVSVATEGDFDAGHNATHELPDEIKDLMEELEIVELMEGFYEVDEDTIESLMKKIKENENYIKS